MYLDNVVKRAAKNIFSYPEIPKPLQVQTIEIFVRSTRQFKSLEFHFVFFLFVL